MVDFCFVWCYNTRMDIKENLATNIARFRKSLNLTQAELAEKLNYSDKAVSKWERGESVPDLTVLKQIADFFGVTIDTLISEPKNVKLKNNNRHLTGKRAIIAICSMGLVWLVATCFFVFINTIFPQITHTWLSFIIAIPVSLIVLLVFTSIWGKNMWNAIFTSILIWTIILCVYLILITWGGVVSSSLWMLFLLGIPLQILTILWFFYQYMR